jgi:hypothetical protein
MAGGMHRKGAERISLHERIHGTPAPGGWEQRQYEVSPAAQPPRIRHCWVTDEHGQLPGLLLEWRKIAAGWQGRVVRPVLDASGWVVVEEWLPAERLAASS